MGKVQTFTNNQLTIDIAEEERTITVHFLGKSILRDPNDFVMPILLRTLGEAIPARKRIVMNFRDLSYMNSSTLTPVIKILERARVGEGQITVEYRKSLKWQDISFSALVIFQTPDGRIVIEGTD
jgi:hypothetical protein